MRILLFTMLFVLSFNAYAVFGFGDDSEVESTIEIGSDDRVILVASEIIKQVWREAKSNDKLSKHTVNVVLNQYSDEYGNKELIDMGRIVFDQSTINEIRKYKDSSLFDSRKNKIHEWVLDRFLELSQKVASKIKN